MRSYHYTCDWCGSAVVAGEVTTLPDGWTLVLFGDDNRGSKWRSKRHLCPDCANDKGTPLNAPETPPVPE